MKKHIIIISMIVFLLPGLGNTLPWSQDDPITINWGTLYPSYLGGYGGLATITNTAKNESIQTFCIEIDEYTTFSKSVFDVSDDAAIWGGRNVPPDTSPDYLSGSTKWLYAQYKAGNSDYQLIPGLVYAIWYLEDEYYDIDYNKDGGRPTPAEFKDWLASKESPYSNIVEKYINDALNNSSYQNPNILVLDTYNGFMGQGGTQGQSFIFSVPEPSLLILLGIGLSAMGLAARRKKK